MSLWLMSIWSKGLWELSISLERSKGRLERSIKIGLEGKDKDIFETKRVGVRVRQNALIRSSSSSLTKI